MEMNRNTALFGAGMAIIGLGVGLGVGYILWGRKPSRAVSEPSRAVSEPSETFETAVNERTRETYEPQIDIPPEIDETLAEMESPEEDEEENEGESDEDPPSPSSNETDGPYVISNEDFALGYPHYDKVALDYYSTDDTLVENGEVVDNRELLVGYDFMYNFGNMSDDPSVVYIRNDNVGSDYEIALIESSYSDYEFGGWSY